MTTETEINFEPSIASEDELEFLSRGAGPRGSRYSDIVTFVRANFRKIQGMKKGAGPACFRMPKGWMSTSRKDREPSVMTIQSYCQSINSALVGNEERDPYLPEGKTFSVRPVKVKGAKEFDRAAVCIIDRGPPRQRKAKDESESEENPPS